MPHGPPILASFNLSAINRIPRRRATLNAD